MSPSVDNLRAELKSLGYLSHGIERWFSRDPWRSGTFWTELLLVSSKASLVIALFAAASATSAMILRNGGLPPLETTIIAGLYFSGAFLAAIVLHVLVAMVLKAKPEFGIENPRALMVIAMMLSGALALLLVAWWSAFPSDPSHTESIVFIALLVCLFFASSIVISAALLSFSIHETQSIPRIHRKPRTVPLVAGATLLLVLIFGRSCTNPRAEALVEASQVVVRPTEVRIVLVAVDGLTPDLFELRPELLDRFEQIATTSAPNARSAPEAWATIGTGTLPSLHRVRSVEGIRFLGGSTVVQHVSPLDYGLRAIAPAIGLAARQPLPPSARNRHFFWESLGERGVPVVAVNWWTSEDRSTGSLRSVSQETIFSRSRSNDDSPTELAIEIDRLAIEQMMRLLDVSDARFSTIYLPALDVILNRVSSSDRVKLAATIRAIDQLVTLLESLSERRWSLVLVGVPGAGDGKAIVATTLDVDLSTAHLQDLAPTILSLYGFPPSEEMPGESLVPNPARISSYGTRDSTESRPVNDEYYESLRSLGYIQ